MASEGGRAKGRRRRESRNVRNSSLALAVEVPEGCSSSAATRGGKAFPAARAPRPSPHRKLLSTAKLDCVNAKLLD